MSFEISFTLKEYKRNPVSVFKMGMEGEKNYKHAIDLAKDVKRALGVLMEDINIDFMNQDDIYTLTFNGKSYSIRHEPPCYNMDIGEL